MFFFCDFRQGPPANDVNIPDYLSQHYYNPSVNHFENEKEVNIESIKKKTRLMLRIPVSFLCFSLFFSAKW
jgi:hypothetical protein